MSEISLNTTLFIIQENLNRYFCPICLILGIIGSLLNICLFSEKQFRRISCCTYFLLSSVTMLIALIVGFSPHIYSVYHSDPTNRIEILCKIRGYLGQSLSMIYRWLMTMACIDRYMVSSENVYLREFANPSFAHSISIKIIIICIIFPIHNLIFLDTRHGWCIFPTSTLAFYHSIFTFIFGAFLPILIMIICAIRIHSNLASKEARRRRNIHRRNSNKTTRLLNIRDYQVLLMLFIQVLIYIFATIPWMIFLLYGPFGYHIKNRTRNRIITEKFVKYLTEIIVYIYSTLSFYIYTLTSRTFRNELFNIIYTIFIGRDRLRYNPQTLIMKIEIDGENKFDQTNKTSQPQSIEMKLFLDSSPKTDFL